MFYYTYKITLLKGSLAGHYYYGQHRTNNLNDGYCGSGRIIKDYFKCYDKIEGITYVKSIIQFYNTPEELNIAENELIGDKYITDNLCINLIPGGNGKGRNKGYKHSDETKQKMSISKKGKKITEEHKNKISESRKGKTFKPHSEETKQKMRESALKRKPLSKEARKKISDSKKGKTPWNKGIKINKNK